MTGGIGILGGTFDPIHCGHLDLGAAAQSALALSSILVMPAQVPPHRGAPSASAFHRFAMVSLAVADKPGWLASEVELGRDEPSYTGDTLTRLHGLGYRPSELSFIIGADAFSEIASWKHYPAVLERAHFAVVSRPGHPVQKLRTELPELASRMIDATSVPDEIQTTAIFLIHAKTADVSSTAIRHQIATGRSIHGMVPPNVEQHIDRHGLYASSSTKFLDTERPLNLAAGRLHGKD